MSEELVRLDELVHRPGVLVVSWWSPQTPAAVAFNTEYAHAAASTEGATFAAVNTTLQPDLAEAFGVDELPSLMVFRDGLLVLRQTGFIPAPAIQQIVRAAQSIDIEELRQAWDGATPGDLTDEERSPAARGGTPGAQPAHKN